jgi:hypothetical protein
MKGVAATSIDVWAVGIVHGTQDSPSAPVIEQRKDDVRVAFLIAS